jgi:hypothetical protein
VIITEENHVIQTKMLPSERKFLAQYATRRVSLLFEKEASFSQLGGEVAQWLHTTSKGGIRITTHIVEAASIYKKAHGHVQVTLHAGARPKIDFSSLTQLTRGLFFDANQGMSCEGCMHLGKGPGPLAMRKVPAGLIALITHPALKTYEDWVGMGAGIELIGSTTLTEGQVERVKTAEFGEAASRPTAAVQQTEQPAPS